MKSKNKQSAIALQVSVPASTQNKPKKRHRHTNGFLPQGLEENKNGIFRSAQLPSFLDKGTSLEGVQQKVFLDRYSLKDEQGKSLEEYPEQMWWRVANGIAQEERTPHLRQHWAREFYKAMEGFKFVPGGRILSGAGTGYEVTFFNCYVIPSPEDSRGGIMENITQTVEIQARGGGVGINLSSLRPNGARVKKVNGTSSGPVSWAALYSAANHDVIQQGGCFSADTLVMTHLGLIPIEELVKSKRDWYVATHEGYKKVTARFDNGIKKVYQVRTSAGYSVKVTDEHQFVAVDTSGHFYLKRLADFKVGESMVMLLGDWRQDLPYHPLNTSLPAVSKFSYGRRKIDLPEVLDEKLAFLLGVYDADGSKIKDEFSPHGKGLQIAVAANRPVDLKKITETIKDLFGINPLVKQGDGAVLNVRVYSREINEFLALNGLLKEYSTNVEVPNLIFSAPRSVVEAYIAGVFLGDGSNRGGKGGFRITTVCQKYAKQIQLLLLNLGIASKIKVEDRSEKKWRDLYTITINGHRFMKNFYQIVSGYSEKAMDKVYSKRDGSFSWPFNLTERFLYLSGIQEFIARSNPYTSQKTVQFIASQVTMTPEEDRDDIGLLASCIADRIVSIDEVGLKQVYDLEIEDIHRLSGGGFYTSNSRRGALMLMLHDWHPDVVEFIHVKEDLTKIPGANLSVCVSDKFMEALENDQEWVTKFPDLTDPDYDDKWDGDIEAWEKMGKKAIAYETYKARDIWDQICTAAWRSAEPGLHFLERSNKWSNTWYFEKLLSTNPCVTGDSWVHTNTGPKKVDDLIGKPFIAVVNGQYYPSSEKGFFKTGHKRVFKLITKEGYSLNITGNHLIKKVTKLTRDVLTTDWCRADKLIPGDRIMVNNHLLNNQWFGEYTFDQGYLMGLLIGDGTLQSNRAVLSVWESGFIDEGKSVMNQAIQSSAGLAHRADFKDWRVIPKRKEYRLSMGAISDLAHQLGMNTENKTITKQIEKASSDFYKGLLRGLFDCDGSVQGSQQKGISVRLAQSNLSLLEAVQRMLLRLGIFSKIYQNRQIQGVAYLPDGKGDYKNYATKAQHELVISEENMINFNELIGFSNLAKSSQLIKLLKSYKRKLNRERFVAEVAMLEEGDIQDVYDAQIPGINSFDANGIVAHNCGEQCLGAWAVCNLGAMNLSSFVKEDGSFDYKLLEETTRIAMRFMDNVVDANYYFLEENRIASKNIRRTGIGTMGLGDAMIKMKLRYGSEEGLEVMEKIYSTIRNVTYEASSDLAKEKGSFPKFIANKYLEGHFIKQLPEYVRAKIKKQGIRNAVILTQAPTGTTSLLAGVSSGIEPVYDFAFVRRDRTGESTIYHPLYKAWKDSHPESEVVPDYFVAANDLTPDDHIKVQVVAQKYTDASISKTVNAPNNHTVEDVKKLYMDAYRLGCKGVTYFRDGSRTGVLSHLDEKKETEPKEVVVDSQDAVVHRPMTLRGRTYKVLSPVGEAFITINRDEKDQPFEVFVTIGKAGMQTSADAEALGRLVSLTLRIARSGNRQGEIAKKIIAQLRGIGGSSQTGFGKDRVMSLADAVGKALAEDLSLYPEDEGEMVPLNLTPQLSNTERTVDDVTSAKQLLIDPSLGADLCPECGNATFVFEEGCKKCHSCGYSLC